MKTFAKGLPGRIALCLVAAVFLLSSASLAESGATWGEPFSSLPDAEQAELSAAISRAWDMILQAHRENAVERDWDAYPLEIVHTIVCEIDSFSDDCAVSKLHKYYCNEAGSPCARIVEFSTLAAYYGDGIAIPMPASVAFYADGSTRVLYMNSFTVIVRGIFFENPLCPCMRAIDAGHAFDGVYSTDDAPPVS